MTGQELERRTPQQELVAQVRGEDFRSQIALALPEDVSVDRFTRITITALQANPQLAELDRNSVFRSLLDSAAMGLLPDGREAAIVPFRGKATLIPMIAGFRKIAADYGWTIYTAIAYERDLFEYEQGLDVRFRHVPVRPGQDRGDPIAAYAVGKHQDGRRELEVLTVEEVEKVRAVSQTGAREDSPWAQWWEQMAEKTAGRRLFKKLPLSEDDKRVRIVRAAIGPEDAAAAMYGPSARAALAPAGVDRETGEIPSGADGPTDDGESGLSATQQAAEAASGSETDSSESAPAASAAPEPEEEPVVEEAKPKRRGKAATAPGDVKIPAGPNEGRTLAELAAMTNGEDWLKYAARNPTAESVGPQVHAALQLFRPDLFEAGS